MLKPQEVSAHAFTKALFRGYNVSMVDEFLDAVAEDYAALYKENATLKAKMKAMAEKVDEYRATEEAMRAALLAAQRTAESMIQDAETRRDEILTNASDEALSRRDDCRREVAVLEERMRRGRTEMARFIAAGRELCAQEMKFLEQLPQMQVNATLPEEPEVPDATDETPSAEPETKDASEVKETEKTEEKASEPVPRLDALKFGQSLKKD